MCLIILKQGCQLQGPEVIGIPAELKILELNAMNDFNGKFADSVN